MKNQEPMKVQHVLIVLLLAITSSSCINIFEDIFLNKDGSGRYELRFDLGAMMNNPMLEGLMDEFGSDSTAQEEVNIFGTTAEDTIVSMLSIAQEAGQTVDRPEFWKDVMMRTKMDEESGEFYLKFTVPFAELDDISYFYENFQDYMPADGENEMFGQGGVLPSALSFTLKRRELTRSTGFGGASEEMAEMDEQEKQMMSMFFTGATYETVYHLPGRVKNADFPNAAVNGKDVTVRTPLLDILQGEADMDGSVKFRRR